jgi:hypothetical protein
MNCTRGRSVLLLAACLLTALASTSVSYAGLTAAQGPRLMRVSPSHGEGLGRDAVVVLSFDRPMDLDSLEKAASFEPPSPFAVSGGSECLVVPLNLLEPGTEYTFRLEPGVAADLEGVAFEGEVEIGFSTRADGMILEIPALSYRGEVIEGRDPQGVASVIGFGVGHYPGTGRPGRSNLVVMAHASGRIGFPFNRLLDLRDGDEIRLSYGGRDYIYIWSEGRVVHDTEVWIVDPTSHPIFTAFICCAEGGGLSPTFHPSYRYVVRAVLKGVE